MQIWHGLDPFSMIQPNPNLDAEEREILEHFERGDLFQTDDSEAEIKAARRAARKSLNKSRPVKRQTTETNPNISRIG